MRLKMAKKRSRFPARPESRSPTDREPRDQEADSAEDNTRAVTSTTGITLS